MHFSKSEILIRQSHFYREVIECTLLALKCNTHIRKPTGPTSVQYSPLFVVIFFKKTQCSFSNDNGDSIINPFVLFFSLKLGSEENEIKTTAKRARNVMGCENYKGGERLQRESE